MSYQITHFVKALTCLLLLGLLPQIILAQSTKEELQEVYLEILESRNLSGFVDEDGDIQFEYMDKAYFIGVDENDPEFFRVVMFNIWPIADLLEGNKVLLALDKVSRDHKVVKGYIHSENVWLAIEMFVESPQDAANFLDRCLQSLEEAALTFVEAM